MNELQIFNYRETPIRTVQRDNEMWWVLKDVCEVLGLSNPTMIAERLEDDEKAKFDLGLQGGATNVINESGLYSVILRSDKPEAKPFRKWVTGEVLPTIRKTGGSCGKIRAVHSGNKKGGGKMKQQKKALSLYEDYETSVTAASDEERDKLNAKFQAMEENCFDLGEDDRGTHFPKMEYSDLAKCFEKEDFAPEIKMEIARACYATYLDGYKGKAFKRHIACELLQEDTEK